MMGGMPKSAERSAECDMRDMRHDVRDLLEWLAAIIQCCAIDLAIGYWLVRWLLVRQHDQQNIARRPSKGLEGGS